MQSRSGRNTCYDLLNTTSTMPEPLEQAAQAGVDLQYRNAETAGAFLSPGMCAKRGREQHWALHWIIRRVLSHDVSTKEPVRVLGMR